MIETKTEKIMKYRETFMKVTYRRKQLFHNGIIISGTAVMNASMSSGRASEDFLFYYRKNGCINRTRYIL